MGNHLKSLAAPKTWPIPRKRFVFVTKQHPGPHTLNSSMPLSVVLRDVLKALSVAREMKKALAAGKILVNGVVTFEDGECSNARPGQIWRTSVGEAYNMVLNKAAE